MITPAGIKKKALKYWSNQSLQQAYLKGEAFFPLTIPFKKTTAKQLLDDFSSIKTWLNTLRTKSKDQMGYGYCVEFHNINNRHIGSQLLPNRIYFESPDDFLRFINKASDFKKFKARIEFILLKQPRLASWLENKPGKVLEYDQHWPKLIEACFYFQRNPIPNCYIRELTIPGVDSKFVEKHRGILRDLLDHLLEPQAINPEITGLSQNGFERRYGLKYDSQLIRFRFLDTSMSENFGLTDISTPVSDFINLTIPCRRIVITENKINGLSFPALNNSIVIFGLGYGVQSLKQIKWFEDKEIFYWGDIDTHGFAMLSQMRSYYPQTRSLLMDSDTLLEFKALWGEEHPDKRCRADLPNLTKTETQLYRELQNNRYAINIRLEQERIDFEYVRSMVQGLN